MSIVKNYLDLIDSAVAKDKVGKLLQYSGLFLKWYYQKQTQNVDLATRFAALQSGCALARKLFRFSKSLVYTEQIRNILKQGQTLSPTDVFKILSSIGMAIYFFVDHIIFLVQIGVIKNLDIERLKKWSNSGWFYGVLFAILADIVVYKILASKDESRLTKADSLQKSKLHIAFVKNITDLQIAGWLAKKATFLSEGWVGLMGIIHSLVALWELYPPK
eukprot:TRINITY_DN6558_c0_g2_i1.p1 TRINITY_DN6558_c0_g2~~TRINITY_DN6558_c0_g2_i1.p1  ORF type:complete len:229 (-),score=35.62 TRINITY_DN6558_c0_g2_i1:57-710(-)